MNNSDKRDLHLDKVSPDFYEPPSVESVLTSEELEREVLYAGAPASAPPAEETCPPTCV